jgi:hypothetical protein
MLTIANNVIHVDLLVQEKRRVSFMYFCTHENIKVFISTDRSSFPNNKISTMSNRNTIQVCNTHTPRVYEWSLRCARLAIYYTLAHSMFHRLSFRLI